MIGANVLIKDGITIGNGSIVTKNIPDYAGNPAKLIRFEQKEIILFFY